MSLARSDVRDQKARATNWEKIPSVKNIKKHEKTATATASAASY